jgi:hypothetical protein
MSPVLIVEVFESPVNETIFAPRPPPRINLPPMNSLESKDDPRASMLVLISSKPSRVNPGV